MPYESKDGRVQFMAYKSRAAHDRAFAVANRKHGAMPQDGQDFATWNKAWTETYAKERANG